MNKYTELSDFDINKKVAENLKLNTIAYERTEIVLFDDMDATPFDPCNNPADAMPIIIENKISLLAGDSNFWCARYGEWNILPCPSGIGFIEKAQVINDSPYRAAMELFLLMKDAERETNT